MIVKLLVISLFTSLACVIIRQDFKSGAMLLSVSCCICIYIIICQNLVELKREVEVFNRYNVTNNLGVAVIIKMLAIAYATSFCSEVCADVGEKSISSAIEVGGKFAMLVTSLPMLCSILKNVGNMLG